jgi:hypothetical protein
MKMALKQRSKPSQNRHYFDVLFHSFILEKVPTLMNAASAAGFGE